MLAYLYAYGGAAGAELRSSLTPRLVEGLEAHQGEVSLNDFLCVQRLAEAPSLPRETRARLERWLLRTAPHTVALDPASWAGHALLPVQAATTPAALLAAPHHDAVQASLDYVLEQHYDRL